MWLDYDAIYRTYYVNQYDDMWSRTERSEQLLTSTTSSVPNRTTVAQQVWDTWLGENDTSNANYQWNYRAQYDEHGARVTEPAASQGSHATGTVSSGTFSHTITNSGIPIVSYDAHHNSWVQKYDDMWLQRVREWEYEQDYRKWCMPDNDFVNGASCPTSASDNSVAGLQGLANTQVTTKYQDKNSAQKSLTDIKNDAYVVCQPWERDVTEWTARRDAQATVRENAWRQWQYAKQRADANSSCISTIFRTELDKERDDIAFNLNQVYIEEDRKLTRI